MLLRLAILACLLFTLPGEARALPAPVVRAWKQSTRAVSRTWSRVTLGLAARSHMALDSVEHGLERRGLDATARFLGESRRLAGPFSPVAMSSFIGNKLAARPGILKGYLVMQVPYNLVRFAMLPLLPAGLGASLFTLTSLPIDVTYFVTAEHLARRRAAPPGQKPSLRSTLRAIKQEYADYRQARDRKIAALVRSARHESLAMAPATP